MSAKYKSPYTYPHRSRVEQAAYICNIGGYARARESRWPIDFNVSCCPDLDFDHIWKEHSQEHVPDDLNPEQLGAYYRMCRWLHKENENKIYEIAMEDTARSVVEDDCYAMLWDEPKACVKLELHGRSGKHLVIAEFDGHTLTGMDSDDLHTSLMSQYSFVSYETRTASRLSSGWEWDGWSNQDVSRLYRYVRQCEVDFTYAKINRNIEYSAAFFLFGNMAEAEWPEVSANLPDYDEALDAAKMVRANLAEDSELLESFAIVCKAAGIHESALDR